MISYIHVAGSMSDLMAKAGMNTLLGMGTVFCVLILIMLLISSFKLLSVFENRTDKKDEKTSVDKAVDQIVAGEEAQDDTELIAVISAAIAAYEGSSSAGSGYVVRSIRRIR
ncbi:MAG: OadG family protein [Lachnospiraceae bacterium]|nr:OadG family protein [Lachnospiraceae bacterium]MBP5744883.1 OadG family protein [Lachnospiraceae bacterium]